MGKYIVELKKNETLYKAATRESDGTAYVCSAIGTPYTEPDMEQVRKEAYQHGLSDAWETARTLWNTPNRKEIFGHTTFNIILTTLTAQEAIEKIRQYEQEKEEIKVGDEVKSGNERYVVLQKYLNNIDEPMAVLFNRRDEEISFFHLYNGNGAIFEKTGRHFPEIAEVLQKMKESDNG